MQLLIILGLGLNGLAIVLLSVGVLKLHHALCGELRAMRKETADRFAVEERRHQVDRMCADLWCSR